MAFVKMAIAVFLHGICEDGNCKRLAFGIPGKYCVLYPLTLSEFVEGTPIQTHLITHSIHQASICTVHVCEWIRFQVKQMAGDARD